MLYEVITNTAHYWYDKLTQGNNIYTISIIDSVVSKICELGYKNVGILATNATIKAKLYQSALETKGINILIPNEKEQKDVMDGIIEVKSGNVEFGTMLIVITSYSIHYTKLYDHKRFGT